jgi:hypothetical protein
MVGGGRARAWRGSLGLATLGVAGCLTYQTVEPDGSSSGDPGTSTGSGSGTSTGGESSTGTTHVEVMTTTEEPGTTEPPPSCDDDAQNQGESDVDCGGPCDGCPDGKMCAGAADCASQACTDGVCVAASCLVDDECAELDGPCTRGVCDPQSFTCASAPANEGEPCDDELLCTTASACAAGECAATAVVDCTGFDSACTQGQCDPETGSCIALDLPDGSDCDDGDGCTQLEACVAGSCVTDEPGAYFFEDFATPAQGWQMDGIWEMGPAAASPSGLGGSDPADDHSPGADRRIAGTGIGELDMMAPHPAWCLRSPPVDVSTSQTLWVSFWRHLHAPAQPDAVHTIDVWNGAVWKNLETGYGAVSTDPDWTFVKYNATGNKATDFMVRICVAAADGAPAFAGWSVDDLVVAPIACTP